MSKYSVACPICAAVNGERCVGANGRQRVSVHRERWDLYVAQRYAPKPPVKLELPPSLHQISHLRRSVSRPNAAKAIERLKGDVSTLIARRPKDSSEITATSCSEVASVLWTLLGELYRRK